MPSFFSSSRKKSSTTPSDEKTRLSPTSDKAAGVSSPKSKSKSSGYFAREHKRRPTSANGRSNSQWSFSKGPSSSSSSAEQNTHPLNLPPEEIRRLSAAMSRAAEQNGEMGAGEPMEMTPAPEERGAEEALPGAFPAVNGDVNGEEQGPEVPPHRTPTESSPQPEVEKVDAEACKAQGDKFYKAGQYGKAIEEDTK